MLPDAPIEETVGTVPPVARENPPGRDAVLVTGSDISIAILLDVAAFRDRTVGTTPSATVTDELASRFAAVAESTIPPEAGLVYVSVRSGLVSGRSPESVRVIVSEFPPGSVLAETVKEPASTPPSDQWEPFVASASTFSLNVTVTEFSDVATAPAYGRRRDVC